MSVKLEHVDTWNERRRTIARRYNELLAGVPNVERPIERRSAKHVYWVYTLRTGNRNRLQQELAQRGIGTHIIYAIPIPFQKAFEYLSHVKGSFPVSERCAEEMISLPMFPELSQEEQKYVAHAIKDCMATY